MAWRGGAEYYYTDESGSIEIFDCVIVGTSTVTASAYIDRSIQGTISGSSQIGGTLSLAFNLPGIVSGSGVVSGYPILALIFDGRVSSLGSVEGVSLVSGNIIIADGRIYSLAQIIGSILLELSFTGNISGAGSVQGYCGVNIQDSRIPGLGGISGAAVLNTIITNAYIPGYGSVTGQLQGEQQIINVVSRTILFGKVQKKDSKFTVVKKKDILF